jgi:tetratricopeptide (TPR) repeat protein
MNFFKKLFGTKDSPTPETKVSVDIKVNADIKPVVNEINIPVDKPKTTDFKVELSSVSRITGLDNEFIDLIYFANPADKESHINNINKALSKLEIKTGADFHKVHEKIIDYNNIDLDEPIPFLIESLMVENFDVRKDSNGKTETKSSRVTKGVEKIQGYYSAASFIGENITLKLNSQNSDFAFEEKLFDEFVLNSDLNNYAKVNAFYCLGAAYFKNSNIVKAEYYFDLIEKTQFDLQPSTVSTYYRNIGEGYADIGDKVKALKWLNAGLTLNPKLGVKKLITKLETDK